MSRWAVALAVSVLLHGALAGVALWGRVSAAPARMGLGAGLGTVDVEMDAYVPPAKGAAKAGGGTVTHKARRHRKQASLLPREAGEARWGGYDLVDPPPRPSPMQGIGEGPLFSAGASALGTAAPFDAAPFLARLQSAARQCAGVHRGEARVRFCVGADGSATDARVLQSSGDPAVDDAALHCVLPKAAPFPAADRCLVVPLAFK